MRRSWDGALKELERADFELARLNDPQAAAPWMERRAMLIGELSRMPAASAQPRERLRLVQAAGRGARLEAQWRTHAAQLRAEAENLYASQLLVKAMAPERRGRHFSLES